MDVVATVRVSVIAAAPVMVTEFDMKLHVAGLVAPVGLATAQVRLTAPVNPFDGVTVIVDVLPVAGAGGDADVAAVSESEAGKRARV